MKKLMKQEALLDSARRTIDILATPFIEIYDELSYPLDFLRAVMGCTALRLLGKRVEMQAGSAKWLVMTEEEQGDAMLAGKEPCGFFGYQFDSTDSLPELVSINYPETLHSWCIDSEGIIYDFSGDLHREAYKLATGNNWPASHLLPDTIAGPSDELKINGWFYAPNQQATNLTVYLHMKALAVASSRIRL